VASPAHQKQYCDAAEPWPIAWAAQEEELLAALNAARAHGATCGEMLWHPPAAPLTLSPALRCASRRHALDMLSTGFVDHRGSDGQQASSRALQAGFAYAWVGEILASGGGGAPATVQAWLGSDAHCAVLMSARATKFGGATVVHEPESPVWVALLGED
jgi:uncharacterized protein YkwD